MARKITGAIGFIIFIWTFGSIFSGADDPIFGKGVVQLAIIGILSLVPYIFIVIIENKQVQAGLNEVQKLIDERKFPEAEDWLLQKGAVLKGDVVEGNLAYLAKLATVYERMEKPERAITILKKLSENQPNETEYAERLKKLTGKKSADS